MRSKGGTSVTHYLCPRQGANGFEVLMALIENGNVCASDMAITRSAVS
jgi:hypothetical protein